MGQKQQKHTISKATAEGKPKVIDVSSDQNPSWLDYIRDYTTQFYRDYFISHYKDPYINQGVQ